MLVGGYGARVSSLRVGINGFGRMGRLALRAGWGRVLEGTGRFRTRAGLEPYFARGVRKVLVAAPVKDGSALDVVVGVNDDRYDPAVHDVLTAASCTTNCLAPVVKTIHEGLRILRGSITTLHDLTNTQTLVDAPHADLRRARAAGLSLIPTTTGSATATGLIWTAPR
jgi:glyceraldehyde 3-phosphate dehydrogenase